MTNRLLSTIRQYLNTI